MLPAMHKCISSWVTADSLTVSTCRVSLLLCWFCGKLDTRIYAQPAAGCFTLVGQVWKHHAMPECSNHHGDELCSKAESNGIHRAESSTTMQAHKELTKMVSSWNSFAWLAVQLFYVTESVGVLFLVTNCRIMQGAYRIHKQRCSS